MKIRRNGNITYVDDMLVWWGHFGDAWVMRDRNGVMASIDASSKHPLRDLVRSWRRGENQAFDRKDV